MRQVGSYLLIEDRFEAITPRDSRQVHMAICIDCDAEVKGEDERSLGRAMWKHTSAHYAQEPL